ncbi:MAG: hypothetical protein OEY28_09160 [Nitrospira sp.]|nr:hypothetical protein [Nitrospira sp.]
MQLAALFVTRLPIILRSTTPASWGKMNASSASEEQHHNEPPLWSIGAAVLIILVTPLVLYSLAPVGPFRDGDTVFSDGQQRALISKPVSPARDSSEETCLLDPNSPLIILQAPRDHSDGSFIAQVQGNPSGEWPFCPVHTDVVLGTHQVLQKPMLFGVVGEMLMKLFKWPEKQATS